jgi:2-C-methyl-D-erythritol 4-phosphate cytidylyltransferase / 2-C-methyl-D-erythritol 2,4-cyclodiphosphate synthase
MKTAALIVAAGRGRRAGGDLPKQWQWLAGRRVADRTLAALQSVAEIDQALLVIHPDDVALAGALGADYVFGGDSRDASVRAGLEALQGQGIGKVLIHDVARPLIDTGTIIRLIRALDIHTGAAPALAVTDALWRGGDTVEQAVPRDGLFRAQTPQAFQYEAILAAHRTHPGGAADDVEVAGHAGIEVAIIEGDERNLKITTPGDFARAERLLMANEQRDKMDIRLGNGYDVHRFGAGDHVVLCGVKIPHGRGLQGHSDADVAMHALTDAIYGALAEGDIGQHFPPSDMQWKGAASDIFLRHAVALASERGFAISNCDVTLICEQPKIGPHAGAMRESLATIMSLETGRISVKATTSERLGFTGREEGIAAMATATLVKS